MARKDRYLVGLDVGTSKVCAIVGEALDDGSLDVVGIGVAESRGIRRGVIVNLEAAVESIKKAIEEAELMAGVEIDAVHLSMAGPHIKGFNSRGVIAVAGKSREITRDDVRRAIEAAKAVSLPAGREILHVLPQDFVVDEQDGIGAPIGMGAETRRAGIGRPAPRVDDQPTAVAGKCGHRAVGLDNGGRRRGCAAPGTHSDAPGARRQYSSGNRGRRWHQAPRR